MIAGPILNILCFTMDTLAVAYSVQNVLSKGDIGIAGM